MKDLTYIGISILLASIIWFAILSNASLKTWGKIDISGIRISFLSLLKKQISLGFKIYSSGLINFFYEPLTKIFISHLIGIKEVGFFDIALKIRNQIWGIVNKASIPLLPFLSRVNDTAKIKEMIHDLEQKIVFLTVPISIIIFFVTSPVISIWIGGENFETIATCSKFIVCSYLILSGSMIPMYLFLMSKGYAEKTIVIQLTNVLVNIIVIFIFYKTLGFYAFIISNIFAIICSFSLMVYYQKQILNSLIFDSTKQFLKILFSGLALIVFGYLLNLIPLGNILKIILIPPFMITFTVLLYRMINIINEKDVHRYFEKDSRLSVLFAKILCR